MRHALTLVFTIENVEEELDEGYQKDQPILNRIFESSGTRK